MCPKRVGSRAGRFPARLMLRAHQLRGGQGIQRVILQPARRAVQLGRAEEGRSGRGRHLRCHCGCCWCWAAEGGGPLEAPSLAYQAPILPNRKMKFNYPDIQHLSCLIHWTGHTGIRKARAGPPAAARRACAPARCRA